MPYKRQTTVTIPTPLKSRLAQQKGDDESWRELFTKVADRGIPEANDE